MPKTGNFIAVKVIDIMESSEELFTNQIKNLRINIIYKKQVFVLELMIINKKIKFVL